MSWDLEVYSLESFKDKDLHSKLLHSLRRRSLTPPFQMSHLPYLGFLSLKCLLLWYWLPKTPRKHALYIFSAFLYFRWMEPTNKYNYRLNLMKFLCVSVYTINFTCWWSAQACSFVQWTKHLLVIRATCTVFTNSKSWAHYWLIK